MAKNAPSITLQELAQVLQGSFTGPSEFLITRPVPAGYNDPNGVTFAGNEAYLRKALESNVGVIIAPIEVPELNRNTIKVADPRSAFAKVLRIMARPLPIENGIHKSAVIHPSANIGKNVAIGPFVVVEANSHIADGVQVFPHSYIGENSKIGAGTIIYPNVSIYQDVSIGDTCIIHSGTVIGADGFGFVWDGNQQFKVPQIGGVIIGNNVEIGANCCIDRATSGETTIADGTKLDNLIQVGHNVNVGRHTVIAALSAIGGSSNIGSNVSVGGQSGFSDHVTVADGVSLAGRSGVMGNIKEPGVYLGLPPVPIKQGMRSMALQQRLPELFQRLRALERTIEELQSDQELP